MAILAEAQARSEGARETTKVIPAGGGWMRGTGHEQSAVTEAMGHVAICHRKIFKVGFLPPSQGVTKCPRSLNPQMWS